MRTRGSVALGCVLALACGLAIAVAACVSKPPVVDPMIAQAKRQEITALWTQIRDWRREGGMQVEPLPSSLPQYTSMSVPEAARVCPETHAVPKECDDRCSLADAICDNAERICTLADELGKGDQLAQEKCSSAKASCREAKQRCCACAKPSIPSLPPAAPGARPAEGAP